ncbi:MAG: AraC family transcriptional regulator [Pseudomonadota bacterium]
MSDELQALAARSDSSYEACAFLGGTVWRSGRHNGPGGSFQSLLPAGLHIGLGAAKIRSFNETLGGFESTEPLLSVLYVPAGGAVFNTDIEPGRIDSFGMHLPNPEIALDEPGIDKLFAFAKDKSLTVLQNDNARHLRRLSAPIDPWFQGEARELILHARALELIAVLTTVLTEQSVSARSPQHTRCAYRVRDQIEADLSLPYALAELARFNGVSVRFLTDAFRSTFNESIGAYLTRRRMEVGAQLITDGASVTQAAYMLGYQPNSFTTAFKRHFGHPPSRLFD